MQRQIASQMRNVSPARVGLKTTVLSSMRSEQIISILKLNMLWPNEPGLASRVTSLYKLLLKTNERMGFVIKFSRIAMKKKKMLGQTWLSSFSETATLLTCLFWLSLVRGDGLTVYSSDRWKWSKQINMRKQFSKRKTIFSQVKTSLARFSYNNSTVFKNKTWLKAQMNCLFVFFAKWSQH